MELVKKMKIDVLKQGESRIGGLDIYRILCCIGVVGYHVFDDVISCTFAEQFYYMCSFCVPGFFLLSGYCFGLKEDVSCSYCEKKAFGVIKKLFGWVLLWAVIHLFRTGELYDIWSNSMQSIVAGGIEPVGWFIFTYCGAMVFAPVLCKINKLKYHIFNVSVLLWMIVLALGVFDFWRDSRAQSLWIHLYIGYFALGIMCSNIKKIIELIGQKYELYIYSTVFFVTSGIYYYFVFVGRNHAVPHQYYGEWYYTLWLLSMFMIFTCIKDFGGRLLAELSRNTFVAYLGHLPILLFITSIKPLSSTIEAVLFILILFVCTQLLAEVFRWLPILRKIV